MWLSSINCILCYFVQRLSPHKRAVSSAGCLSISIHLKTSPSRRGIDEHISQARAATFRESNSCRMRAWCENAHRCWFCLRMPANLREALDQLIGELILRLTVPARTKSVAASQLQRPAALAYASTASPGRFRDARPPPVSCACARLTAPV
jgi:hypothetical protein